MFGFGKKKISEEEAVLSSVKALIDDVNESYPWFLHQWKTSSCSNEFPPIRRDSIDLVRLAVLALEIISLPYLFSMEQANRIKHRSITCFAERTGKVSDEVLSEVETYERLFNETAKTNPSNPLKGMCEHLAGKFWSADARVHGKAEPGNPNFILSILLETFLAKMSGCWKGLRHYYHIIPGS